MSREEPIESSQQAATAEEQPGESQQVLNDEQLAKGNTDADDLAQKTSILHIFEE